jgi:hypothetical protein
MQEVEEIAICLLSDYGERQLFKTLFHRLNKRQVTEYLQDCYITVIDGYVSDAKGYAGKVIIIIWAAPEFITTIIEDEETGKLKVIKERQ